MCVCEYSVFTCLCVCVYVCECVNLCVRVYVCEFLYVSVVSVFTCECELYLPSNSHV